jgi:hypothetical protein
MMRRPLPYSTVTMVLALCCGGAALAPAADADIAGVWKGTMDTQMGPVETIITIDPGTTLAGKVKVSEYEGRIEKGRRDGDRISFEINIERGTITYDGTVSGDEMKLNVVGTTGNKMTLVAKRQK